MNRNPPEEVEKLRASVSGEVRGGEKEEEAKKKRRPGTTRGFKMTDRDRDLVALLAVTRYLTIEQLGALYSPGGDESVPRKRVSGLAGIAPGGLAEPVLRRIRFDVAEGRCEVFALTKEGHALALKVLATAPRMPRKDIGLPFLKHQIGLNQLFVDLARDPRGRAPCRVGALPFRWVGSESLWLTFAEYHRAAGKSEKHLLQPDAVLELPAAKRRSFIEYETGSHPIVSSRAARAGATVHKVARYASFITGYADSDAGVTFYDRAYPDGWEVEVVFLVESARRKDNVNRALRAWGERRAGPSFVARALVRAELVGEVAALLRRAPPPVGPPPAVDRRLARTTPSGSFVLTPHAVETLARYFDSSQDRIHEFRSVVRGRAPAPDAVPAYPEESDEVHDLLSALRRR
jgi:hypothetical protein